MKKLFIVLAVASLGFAACNNESDSAADAEKMKQDSIHKADSIAAAQATADSLAKAQAMDTMNKMSGDTSKMKK